MHEFAVKSSRHTEFIVIDREIQAIVTKAGLQEGVVHVFIPHTTAGITINENADPDVKADIEKILGRVVPWEGGYAHAEGNSAAHVKASLMGFSALVPVHQGRLQFGTWQSLYFCEFDGPRHRKVWVTPLTSA
ncbi:MAG: YjbQ family protein [Candidatus Hydrogenedentes bacterium]|nr:YjbQ family protein [Candidatus Hydrogenedentota bacterium]